MYIYICLAEKKPLQSLSLGNVSLSEIIIHCELACQIQWQSFSLTKKERNI